MKIFVYFYIYSFSLTSTGFVYENLNNYIIYFYFIYLFQQQYGTACFWADKLVCLEKCKFKLLKSMLDNPNDVLLFAQALYHNRQYHRAISLILNQKEIKVCKSDINYLKL